MRWLSAILMLLFSLSLASCSSVSDGKESGKKEKEAEPVTAMFKVEPFIMNLNDPEYERVIKIGMDIELTGPVIAEKAKTKTPAVRDTIITLVSGKTYDTLVSPEGKLMLKDEIIERLNRILGEKSVSNVYITDFVMQ